MWWRDGSPTGQKCSLGQNCVSPTHDPWKNAYCHCPPPLSTTENSVHLIVMLPRDWGGCWWISSINWLPLHRLRRRDFALLCLFMQNKVTLSKIIWIWWNCIRERNVFQARQTVLSSSRLVCSLASWGNHTYYAAWLSMWLPHPLRDASVIMVTQDVGGRKGTFMCTCSGFIHSRREALTLRGIVTLVFMVSLSGE